MRQKLYLLKNKLGIDGAIAFTSISRIIQAIGGIVSVVLVASLLNGIEQGFYYTFASILAIQVFFELGLNGIITQYVAHEVSHLKQVGNHYEGNEVNLSRVASLLHFTVKWFSVLAVFVFLLLLGVGYMFFNYYYKSDVVVDWHYPWILLSLGTTLNFLLSPIMAFIEGLGKVKEIAKIRMFQQFVGLLLLWTGLAIGLKLYVGGISSIIGILILLFFIVKMFLPILKSIYHQKITERISYKTEIFPLQWKIALSWVGGYFIFQLFNPVLFATDGPVVAGQMGMTLSVLNAVLALSYAWVSTKIPVFSGYISQQNFTALDKLFNATFLQSSLINVTALLGVFFVIFFIRFFNVELVGKQLADKFLTYIPLSLMMISFFMNHLIGSWAVYLRCHKKEPMLINSLAYGILSCLSTIILGNRFGILGITAGYCFISVIIAVWAFRIFQIKKVKWHIS
ncbi:polysaccharide biosynthesis protein [Flavobacterium yafengii]|uniref:polysaccharide biosynthesis protein n=1 Tax=Flavobacterium yafengii TaxID=3041253 RepID=UPI0024A8B84B|nr:polysaccharide biosynthesis protein [Flavobacterium yafengii]MDI5899190.1 polysaccharide biosynthesis protein [Flavobacterium yafengii]